MMTAHEVKRAIAALADPVKAEILQRFFKTGPGEYAEGDVFLGLVVGQQRKIARQFKTLPLAQIRRLLRSRIHEQRLVALLILTDQFERGEEKTRGGLHRFYLANTRYVNNWDLVDLSAPRMVGAWLQSRSRKPLYRLVTSRSLWERRISIVATFHLIRQGDFQDTLALAERLLGDSEDLIHKAAGWMLREVGKRDREVLESFLDAYAVRMPRTMLRYAIERFPEPRRQHYLRTKKQSQRVISSGG